MKEIVIAEVAVPISVDALCAVSKALCATHPKDHLYARQVGGKIQIYRVAEPVP